MDFYRCVWQISFVGKRWRKLTVYATGGTTAPREKSEAAELQREFSEAVLRQECAGAPEGRLRT